MKLWDVLAMCFLLLSAVSASPLLQSLRSEMRLRPLAPTLSARPLQLDGDESEPRSGPRPRSASESAPRLQESPQQYEVAVPDLEQFEDVLDFIKATIRRTRRSPEWDIDSQRLKQRPKGTANPNRGGGVRKEGRRARGRQRGRGAGSGCVLKQLHLNVTDLGLGYQTKEELIFKYCSGPCTDSEANYDRILNNLAHSKKLDQDAPVRACCRPIAFDDDLSFLDDNLTYHTLRRHSAKKCACV
ncbi:glial cell line-derived neurotrophic factor isoform X1 [Scleropages formosus]|nr:glial cell line-derived neurotrophic factor-like isoform X1 [Scleropages formosus]